MKNSKLSHPEDWKRWHAMNTRYICPICGANVYYVLMIHAEKHNMTLDEFAEKYPKSRKFMIKDAIQPNYYRRSDKNQNKRKGKGRGREIGRLVKEGT